MAVKPSSPVALQTYFKCQDLLVQLARGMPEDAARGGEQPKATNTLTESPAGS